MPRKPPQLSILITGATGFIGSNVVERLSKQAKIFALVRALPRNRIKGVEYIVQDLRKPLRLKLLPLSAILHLAQANTYERRELFKLNVKSTFELLEYGKRNKIKKFIYASAGNVYGFGKTPFFERDQIVSNSFYGAAKAAAEALAWQYRDFFDVNVIRLFAPYGEGQQQERLIPSLIRKIKRSQPIIINNRVGNPRISPIYINDVVEVIRRTIKTKGSFKINVAGPKAYSILEIAKLLGKILNKNPKYHFIKNAEISDIIADIALMKKILRFTPKVGLNAGLTKLCAE